jgi:hypothetical protein
MPIEKVQVCVSFMGRYMISLLQGECHYNMFHGITILDDATRLFNGNC